MHLTAGGVQTSLSLTEPSCDLTAQQEAKHLCLPTSFGISDLLCIQFMNGSVSSERCATKLWLRAYGGWIEVFPLEPGFVKAAICSFFFFFLVGNNTRLGHSRIKEVLSS